MEGIMDDAPMPHTRLNRSLSAIVLSVRSRRILKGLLVARWISVATKSSLPSSKAENLLISAVLDELLHGI